MQKLINEYRQSLREFKKSKVDTYKAGMIGDTQFAIEYMETGRMPGAKWTVARWPIAKREVPFDPSVVNQIYEGNEPVRQSTDREFELVEELLHCLSEREKEVYKMVYGEMFSLGQTANILGVSKARVQGCLKRAYIKMAHFKK